ncbi:Polysaccharide deacetylase [Cyclobacterium lianum]|uniref:Polysaccharide deacetylase n=1 Tax=Cyclobacterium lianum TaxID=388280 RepID=A0A1M7QKG8_9BACT|nr:polysaccharide deacetylase family protein [Cyclobacterium lianum]SHN31717.1 Polysaccharide deacetylase [Cyclobacterium lianum]
MNQPAFIISLDFELHWGRFDKVPLAGNEAYYHRTKELIPGLLSLFAEYEIGATWATVGMLMAENAEEWEHFSPKTQPHFKNPKYSAYHWFRSGPADQSCLFAPDLVRHIIRTPRQELGSHTFAHYYTRVLGPPPGSFTDDLKAAKRIAMEKFGIELHSLVLPRNQYNPEVLQTAWEMGFQAIRTNPSDWFWRSPEREGYVKKSFRAADSYWSLGNKTSYLPASGRAGCSRLIPASRFFRPYQERMTWMNRLKLERVKQEMTEAGRKGEVYHLWWHPHNHGNHPRESLEEVRMLLDHFAECRATYGMHSMTMADIASRTSSLR